MESILLWITVQQVDTLVLLRLGQELGRSFVVGVVLLFLYHVINLYVFVYFFFFQGPLLIASLLS